MILDAEFGACFDLFWVDVMRLAHQVQLRIIMRSQQIYTNPSKVHHLILRCSILPQLRSNSHAGQIWELSKSDWGFSWNLSKICSSVIAATSPIYHHSIAAPSLLDLHSITARSSLHRCLTVVLSLLDFFVPSRLDHRSIAARLSLHQCLPLLISSRILDFSV